MKMDVRTSLTSLKKIENRHNTEVVKEVKLFKKMHEKLFCNRIADCAGSSMIHVAGNNERHGCLYYVVATRKKGKGSNWYKMSYTEPPSCLHNQSSASTFNPWIRTPGTTRGVRSSAKPNHSQSAEH